MVIIPVGSLILQVEREQSERRFKERLLAEITEQVLRVIARCIEAMLEFDATLPFRPIPAILVSRARAVGPGYNETSGQEVRLGSMKPRSACDFRTI
jgi:hypothetical protein